MAAQPPNPPPSVDYDFTSPTPTDSNVYDDEDTDQVAIHNDKNKGAFMNTADGTETNNIVINYVGDSSQEESDPPSSRFEELLSLSQDGDVIANDSNLGCVLNQGREARLENISLNYGRVPRASATHMSVPQSPHGAKRTPECNSRLLPRPKKVTIVNSNNRGVVSNSGDHGTLRGMTINYTSDKDSISHDFPTADTSSEDIRAASVALHGVAEVKSRSAKQSVFPD
ncbi:hypothetical protein V5O48_014261 [Marasmius crinis-equi]|uniref:Uncharacterized protein n=1 Tax=Marasmius crinis-equi TaxID=585013 RepID=A0ABR3EXT4_9AGAR